MNILALQVAVSSLSDDLDTQRQTVSDLRKRLSETSGQLSSERRRIEALTMQRDEQEEESRHNLEMLQEKLRHSQSHLDSCKDDHADTRGMSESLQMVRATSHGPAACGLLVGGSPVAQSYLCKIMKESQDSHRCLHGYCRSSRSRWTSAGQTSQICRRTSQRCRTASRSNRTRLWTGSRPTTPSL